MLLDRLPRELRDMIYNYYTTEDGGFHFDPESGKLRTLSGEKIELSLMYTCKAIASELQGLPFRNNAVHFTTSPVHDRCTPTIRHFGNLLEELYAAKNITLARARPFITDRIAGQVAESFPQTATLLHHLQTTKRRVCADFENLERSEEWGLAPSFYRDAVAELLRMVALNPSFGPATRNELFSNCYEFPEEHRLTGMYLLHPQPWCIPSRHEIAAMEQQMPLPPHDLLREQIRDNTKYYVSAASQASHFLSHLPLLVRMNIRRLELHEIHVSIAHPECHARGLIPFAIENPKLRIRRRVDLWNAVLASPQLYEFEEYRHFPSEGRPPFDDMDGTSVTSTVAKWLTEASALAPAGMPAESFRLVFESETNSAQPIFDILIEDASWQDALQQWPGRYRVSTRVQQRCGTGYRSFTSYFFEELPGMMRSAIKEEGPVIFENCQGQVWNPRQVLAMNTDCNDMVDWHAKWETMRSRPIAPLLPRTWHAILEGYVC